MITRFAEKMDLAAREERALALLKELEQPRKYLEWLLVHNGGRLLLIKVEQVTWIEAQGNYARVHHNRGSHLIRESIGALESRLNPHRFARIHRSAIVHRGRIRELQAWQHGEYRVILENGTELMLSRTYRVNLRKAIGVHHE